MTSSTEQNVVGDREEDFRKPQLALSNSSDYGFVVRSLDSNSGSEEQICLCDSATMHFIMRGRATFFGIPKNVANNLPHIPVRIFM